MSNEQVGLLRGLCQLMQQKIIYQNLFFHLVLDIQLQKLQFFFSVSHYQELNYRRYLFNV